jgi:hypothetical protein
MLPDFTAILAQFAISGRLLEAYPYGSGHINDTYLAQLHPTEPGKPSVVYVLQRINQQVFKRPELVMRNIELVTAHLRSKIMAAGGDPRRETLTLIPTRSGASFYRTPGGDYWRAYQQIPGAQTYQQATQPLHYYSAARAFGRFQQLLSDFPVEQLGETIPDFHNTPKRFAAFRQAIERDAAGRSASVGSEIAFACQRQDLAQALTDPWSAGELATRVTHNDTKFDNVMIDDQTGAGVCVIDLDTVMPGLSLFDFGDLVRSAANPAAEDEPDLTKVTFDLVRFDLLARGFLEETRGALAPAEIDRLALAARVITFEQGLRFLTDHLNGDVYYKIQRANHNLERARTQFKLVEEMEGCFQEMEAIIGRYR